MTLCFSCLQISLKSIWLSLHSCTVEMKYKHYHKAGLKNCFSPSFSTGSTSHYLEFLKTTLIIKWLSTPTCTREISESCRSPSEFTSYPKSVMTGFKRDITGFSVHSLGNSSSQTKILFHSSVLPPPGHTWNRAVARLGQKQQPKGNDSTLPRSFYGYQISPTKWQYSLAFQYWGKFRSTLLQIKKKIPCNSVNKGHTSYTIRLAYRGDNPSLNIHFLSYISIAIHWIMKSTQKVTMYCYAMLL